MRRFTSTTRALQIGIVILLVVSLAQVFWWTLDQVFFTAELRGRFVAHWADDQRAATQLLAHGTPEETVEQIFPHLVIEGGLVSIRPESVHDLDSERYHRLRRYGWEGGFFITVLVIAIGVVSNALHQEAELRKRQQNFIATVSHEFKSPLASLQLSAETMSMRELNADRREVLVSRMLDDVERMEGMASKILSITRLEQGRVELKLESTGLLSSLKAALDSLEARADEASVEIEAEVAPELRVHADPLATRTVLQNLLENAIKATAAAGGGLVTVRAARSGTRVVLEVCDEGIGFEPREAKKIFEKFYRSGDEMRRTTTGTGLGLYIVERLMSYQGGSVKAHSDGPDRGAVFTVGWPVAQEGSRDS